ncbi:hypothetical protein Rhe02_05060 [Rhizocola hellebori]|uniref:TIR domain-containing protein n=1 Tax=Rhizocola hellebori TaxID=1392758 RepID=A0A8J3VCD1_9ACTN|nr:toll/interleukin-1 receptor domain-containing protein [Rhizocola hellebori]GIH02439.1 hypothetical protein Rhe02_05060 [Rhizocola hellebori]
MRSGSPRIFVSYSACKQPGCLCQAARDSTVRLLETTGCEPVVDQLFLEPGEPWHPRILREMLTCDAAVILLSEHALESKYVHEEAIVCRLLAEYSDGRFAILPVLIPPATRARLKESPLGAVELTDLQMAQWESEQISPPPALKQAVGDLQLWHRVLPEPRIYEVVSKHVGQAHRHAIEDAAAMLELPPTRWLRHLPDLVAVELLKERLVETKADPLRLAMKRLLPTVPADGRRELIERVVPFARIPTETARQLRHIAGQPTARIAAIQAAHPLTPLLYLRRASDFHHVWAHFEPSPGSPGNFAADLVSQIREFLVDTVSFGVPCTAQELDELLHQHEDEDGPIAIVIRFGIDVELRDRLCREFPTVLFLYVEDHRAQEDQLSVRTLAPAQESALIRTYNELCRKFGGQA